MATRLTKSKSSRGLANALSNGKQKPLEDTVNYPLPRLVRTNTHVLNKAARLFANDILAIAQGTQKPEFAICFAVLADEVDERTLNEAFVFEGYENKTREALRDLFLHTYITGDHPFKASSLEVFDFYPDQKTTAFLMHQAVAEQDYLSLDLPLIRRLIAFPERTGRFLEETKHLLYDENPAIRMRFMYLLLDLGPSDLQRMAVDALLVEPDDYVYSGVFSHIASLNTVTLPQDALIRFVSDVIKRQSQERNDVIYDALFSHFIPSVENVELLVNLVAETDSESVLDKAKPTDFNHEGYIMGYHYFAAASRGELLKAEVNGETFSYVLALDFPLMGSVYLNALLVSSIVPEKLRPVVAYHEFTESKTHSHHLSVIREMQGAHSLGVEQEYLQWAQQDECSVRKEALAYFDDPSVLERKIQAEFDEVCSNIRNIFESHPKERAAELVSESAAKDPWMVILALTMLNKTPTGKKMETVLSKLQNRHDMSLDNQTWPVLNI